MLLQTIIDASINSNKNLIYPPIGNVVMSDIPAFTILECLDNKPSPYIKIFNHNHVVDNVLKNRNIPRYTTIEKLLPRLLIIGKKNPDGYPYATDFEITNKDWESRFSKMFDKALEKKSMYVLICTYYGLEFNFNYYPVFKKPIIVIK